MDWLPEQLMFLGRPHSLRDTILGFPGGAREVDSPRLTRTVLGSLDRTAFRAHRGGMGYLDTH
ncbi:hypothetical protein MYSI104531_26350 [Mycobacterium simiae]